MKKELTKALTLATTGAVAVTSALSPATPVFASTETNFVSEQETTENGGSSTDDTGGNDILSITDIGVIGSMVGSSVVLNNTHYSRDLAVKLSADSLKENVSVVKVELYAISDGEEDKLIGGYEGKEGSISIDTFSGTLQLRYYLSNNQVLSQNLSEVVTEFNGITSFVKDVEAPEFKGISFDGETSNYEDVVYYTNNGNVTVSFEDLLSGVDKGTWSVEGVSSFNISEDGKNITFETNGLEDGLNSITVSVKDIVGNLSSIVVKLQMYRNGVTVSAKEINGVYSTVNSQTFIKEGDSLEVQLSGYDNSMISKVEVVDSEGIVLQDVTENGKVTLNKETAYSVKITDILGKEYLLSISNLTGDKIADNVVFDNNAPTLSVVSYSGEIKTTVDNKEVITKSGTYALSLEDLGSGVDWNTVSVSGAKYDVVDNIIFVSTEYLEDGSHTLEVAYKDNVGNSGKTTFELFILRDIPKITGNKHGIVLTISGVSYVLTDVEVTLKGYDKEGIQKLELLKAGVVDDTIDDGKFTLTESGVYSVRVTDILGNYKDYSLNDLFSDGSIESDVVFDKGAPTLDNKSFNGEIKVVDEYTYYVSNGDITLLFKDTDSGVDSKSFVSNVNFTVTEDGNGITIGTSKLPEGLSEITVSVKDKLGNKFEYPFSVYMCRTAPEITGASFDKVALNENTAYVNGTLGIRLNGTSAEKVKTVELWKGSSKLREVEGGSFVITESGEYTVRVVDIVENAVVYRLEDLFTGLYSNVVVDEEVPSVKVTVNGSEINQKEWVVNKAILKVDVTDNIGLSGLEVTVNGKRFNNQYSLAAEGSLSVDLQTDVDRAKDGKYVVEVVATDFAGNSKLISATTVLADFDKPEFTQLVGNGKYLEDEETGMIYLRGKLNITGSCEDIGSGVSKVELFKDGEVVATGLPMSISKSGKYTIRVTDNAGLYTECALNDVLGLKNNDLIVDNDNPVITLVSGFTCDLEQNGLKWYANAPEFVVDVEDANLKTVKVTVNGDVKVDKVSENNKYTVNTEGYEGKVTVVVYAEDRIGNTYSETFVYMADFTAPVEVDAFVDKSSITKAGTVFFKETPSIEVSAKDNGVGIKEYRLSGSKSETNTTGKFTLGDGSYYVEVIDKLGNVTEVIPVNTLLDLSSNVFVVDTESPEFTVSKPMPEYIQVSAEKNWYGDDIDYKVDFKDNIGIDRATISINGQKVKEFATQELGVLKASLTANTSEVPQSSNGMYTVKVSVVDNAGNSYSKQEVFYIDRETPIVNEFVFTGDGSYEGVNINGSDRYGFFFNGGATCEIHVSDGIVSSGLNKVYVTLEDVSGEVSNKELEVVNGVATVTLPENFKGFISAYVKDKVGHTSITNKPDGVITESSNYHINTVKLDVTMPETTYKDISGIILYSKDTTAIVDIGCNISGIKQIEWGIDKETKGTVSVDSDGDITGDVNSVNATSKNIVLSLDKVLELNGNANGLKLWVKVTDRVGHVSETSRLFSIDKDAPIISVSYDNTEGDSFYNKDRVATITVQERNFDPTKFKVSGVSGILGTWSRNGDVWSNTITFNKDEDYKFTLNCTDMAGNVAKEYVSEGFTVDKTVPKMSVYWNLNNPTNGNFYNAERVATITIEEHNFDASRIKLTGSGTLSAWKSNGDVHTATITFSENGEYEFSITGDDKAGNLVETYNSGKFIVDISKPTISIEGVQKGVSYKKNVAFTVSVKDSYIDTEKTFVTLTGRKNGEIRLGKNLGDTDGVFTLDSIPEEVSYDDVYTLKVVVTDKAGNTVEESLKFSVNRFGSEYSFLKDNIVGGYLNEAPDISISETNVDRLDTSKCKIVIMKDGKEFSVDSKYLSISELGGELDKYVYTYSVDKGAFSEDGKYTIQIYSTSEDGTTYNSVSQEYVFILDTESPEVITSGIESGKKYHEYTKTFTIDVRDFSGVKVVNITLNGKEVDWEKSNGVYSFDVKESKERQEIVVTVEDMAGNTSTVTVDNFLVTSDIFVYLINQTWFKFTLGGVALLLILIIGLIAKNRRDAHKDEEIASEEYKDLYKTSSGSSSVNSSQTSSSGKDLVEDLESTEDSVTQVMEEPTVEDLDK